MNMQIYGSGDQAAMSGTKLEVLTVMSFIRRNKKTRYARQQNLVLCEYSKFRIESNSYFSIRFDSKQAQLFEIFEYLPSPISYLFNRMTPIFQLSNHA